MRVTGAYWFSSMTGVCGLVVGEDERTGEKKAYIGVVDGLSEEADTEHIKQLGSPVSAAVLQEIIEKVLERPETAPEEPPLLTKTQGDILGLVARGCRNSEIAEALSIPRKKVSNHISDLLVRLDAKNRAHAVTIAVRKGIISFESEAK